MKYALQHENLAMATYHKIPGKNDGLALGSCVATFRVLRIDPNTGERTVVWRCQDTGREETDKTYLEIENYAGQTCIRISVLQKFPFPLNFINKGMFPSALLGVYIPQSQVIVKETHPKRLAVLSRAPVYNMPGHPTTNLYNATFAGLDLSRDDKIIGLCLIGMFVLWMCFGMGIDPVLTLLMMAFIALALWASVSFFGRDVLNKNNHVYSEAEAEAFANEVMEIVSKETILQRDEPGGNQHRRQSGRL